MAKTKTAKTLKKPAPKKPSPKGRSGKPLARAAAAANGALTPTMALAGPMMPGQAVAAPQFVQPPSGFFATPGADLRVIVSTLRPDLRYIIALTDVTDALNPGAPQAINIPAPLASGSAMLFAADIPGASLVLGCKYQIRVFVDPLDGASPPHNDAAVDITCIQLAGLLVIAPNGPMP